MLAPKSLLGPGTPGHTSGGDRLRFPCFMLLHDGRFAWLCCRNTTNASAFRLRMLPRAA